MTMPWIAFVPDISGVCSSVGTFEITSKPRKIASTRIVSSTQERAVTHAVTSRPRHARAGGDLVVEVERELAVRARGGAAARTRCARRAGSRGRASARRGRCSPTIVTPPRSTSSPGSVSSQLPPASAARSTITEPGRMRSTAAAGISFGAGRPGMSAVVITTSMSGIRSSSAACCRACCSGESSAA